ncbi:MAG: PD40 domain-containing protein [Anaerolineae bacterium]|nr:PD40 domain-containing protein [Anaerolineae bacterium]
MHSWDANPAPRRTVNPRRAGAALALVLLLAAASPLAGSLAQVGCPAPLAAAWIDNGSLITWRSDDPVPRLIAENNVEALVMSPEGARVAFLRRSDDGPDYLWISALDGSDSRQLVSFDPLPSLSESRRPLDIVWARSGVPTRRSDTLYFNTLIGEGIGIKPADDLWQVTLAGDVTRLLPDGDGGAITPSPDGRWLALSAAGDYSQPGEPAKQPGTLAFFDTQTQTRTRARTTVLEFPAVATGSEQRWHAQPVWLPDSSGVIVAIPPADLLYGGDETLTRVWRLPVDGEAVLSGTVEADFFGLPAASPDGEWIVYVERRAAPQDTGIKLKTARADGDGAALVAEGSIGQITTPAWLPDAQQFVYTQAGIMWLGAPGQPPVDLLSGLDVPDDITTITAPVWVDAHTFVFATQPAEGAAFTLYAACLGGTAQIIAQADTYPLFDAVALNNARAAVITCRSAPALTRHVPGAH